MSTLRHRWLVGLELATGAAALIGGVLLVAKPDGSLIKARLSALEGSPFSDWRVPGMLLAVLVGGGWLTSGVWELKRGRHADALSAIAGAGLVAFEGVELRWIGAQPLEAVFGAVGATVLALAVAERNSVDQTRSERINS